MTDRSPNEPDRTSEDTGRSRVLRRLASLRNLEGLNIFLFWLLFFMAWERDGFRPTWGFRAYALTLTTLILAQGSYYWHLKLRSVTSKRPLPPEFRAQFMRLRQLNVALFVACVPVAWLLFTRGASGPSDLTFGALLVVFAVLEHLNYFHVQLMHDTRNDWAYLRRHRRLRRAPLARDAERCR